MINELLSRDVGAVLITFNANDIDFEDVTSFNGTVSICGSDDFTDVQMKSFLVLLGSMLERQTFQDIEMKIKEGKELMAAQEVPESLKKSLEELELKLNKQKQSRGHK